MTGLVGLVVLATVLSVQGFPKSSKDVRGSIAVGSDTREYLIHIPDGLEGKLVPLVLVFHGGGGNAASMPRFTGFDRLADEQGFIVAYPDSVNKHWDDSRGLSPGDDVGFVNVLIAHLEQTLKIDSKRIYATGISNGGFFSQRLACDLTDKLAAVASVAATMPDTLPPLCKPARPISVLFMHGTKDPIVRIDGGPILRNRGSNVSLAEASSFWRKWDATDSKPHTENLPDRVHDGTHVHFDRYGGGKDGTEVVIYTIEGGGHAWPGGAQYMPAFLVGKASKNLDATQAIWEFFKRH
jgi:polyhydroxybutyrate depolymerase